MPRQLLLEIFEKKLFLDLGLFILSGGITWFFILSLGFHILKVKIPLKKILFGALFGVIIGVFLKPFIPRISIFFLTMIFSTIYLKFYGKTKWIIACWVTFLLLMLTSIGPLVIISPLAKNKAVISFIFGTRYGNMLGSLCEGLAPAIVLVSLRIFNVSLIPSPGKLLSTIDFYDIFLYGALLYWCFESFVNTIIIIIQNNPQESLLKSILEWAISGGAVIAFYLRKARQQKKLEYAADKIQELEDSNNEKSTQLEQLKEIVNKIAPTVFNDKPTKNLSPQLRFNTTEMKVLQIIATEGKSNKEIADALSLKEGTVKNTVVDLLRKTNSADRTQLAIYAIKNDLVENG